MTVPDNEYLDGLGFNDPQRFVAFHRGMMSWWDDHERRIRMLLKPYLTDWELDGDKYGAHGAPDQVEFFIERYKLLENELKELKK